ncbi:protein kinase [Kitasatospora aureofaciens]|uniref:serine/threonine protein kinase n=1 Tax=Kitasatospora aureofaciens TaxID=1894 RepID=UPI001C43AB3C|nr:protein kinase [Kitasatospora aureofaciens]MBV6701562.1 protein kinase [Kitasatospora aureofaciens]
MRGTMLADRYRLVDWLGGGSMGDVWLAEDEVLGRRVAVKVVKPALLDEPGFAERFHAEACVMAKLRHPGIVGVHDYGHSATDGQRSVAYLVMELIDGEPLSAVLERRGSLPVAETLRMALQVLEALEAAHESGVVHRDIKPANLMVRGGQTVIADFGIARPGCDARLTVPGVVLGTAAYQAPEQASTGTVTASADLYALGVVLYECLAGRLPFDGETALKVILKHLTEPVPPLPDEVPEPVWALVERAMAKEPGERWPDAAAMAEAVRDALAVVGEDVPPAPDGPRSVVRRTPRAGFRRRTLIAVAVMALLCVGGATGATVIRPGQGDPPSGDAVVAEPTADPARPVGPVPVDVGRPLGGLQSTEATTPVPSASPSAGDSPTPGVGPASAIGRTSIVPTRPDASEPTPAASSRPAAPAVGQTAAAPAQSAAPAPTSAAPRPPASPEPTTPTAPATPPQPTQPPKPEPQLPAVAQFTTGGVALDNSYSTDKDGNLVGTYTVNHSPAQMWRLEKFSEGRYYLRNASSSFTKVLDLDLATGKIQIWTNPPGAENQLWSFVPVSGGYQIVNSYTKQCLTSDGPAQWARVQACSTADNQVWTVS